jgi:hypothetical protein
VKDIDVLVIDDSLVFYKFSQSKSDCVASDVTISKSINDCSTTNSSSHSSQPLTKSITTKNNSHRVLVGCCASDGKVKIVEFGSLGLDKDGVEVISFDGIVVGSYDAKVRLTCIKLMIDNKSKKK